MRLAGAVTVGSGAINEDGLGYLGTAENVSAAWVFDGVTGINGQKYLQSGTDAAWLVERAHQHLLIIAAQDLSLPDIILQLVQALIADWSDVANGIEFPKNYDPPAACLILVKRYDNIWRAVRLGDSCLLSRAAGGRHKLLAVSPNNAFDHWLTTEATKRRESGVLDMNLLLAEFQPQLAKGRRLRNTQGGYGILEASLSAVRFAEYIVLENPSEILLCTDGYYRAVDYYALYSEVGLLEASLATEGINSVLSKIRAAEAADPVCEKYHRFKPSDDATALVLRESA